jgi:hypothetical protein
VTRSARTLALGLLGLALGLSASAHIRILHPTTGAGLFWPGGSSTGIAFQAAGSDDIPDDSDEVAVRNAIAVWNAVEGSNFTLVEDTSDATQARTDWQTDSLHLVWFDEDNSSGYFPGSAGVVALTPLWFFSSGAISDADVIFNGKNFSFTTSGQPGRFDVQDVAAHEIGHFLGLDHSGYTGATMYPFVDPTVILHRSLALDDSNGLRSIYPAGSFARLTGRVERGNGSGVVRAHVVALDEQGRVAGAALADAAGNFQLTGLEAGTYQVYADPFDNPVSAANLTGSYSVDIDYQTTFYPGSHAVDLGQTVALGTLTVGADVPLQLGRSSDRLPRRATIGTTTSHSLRGSGLLAGSTLSASDPDLSISSVNWLGSIVTFSVTVPADEAPGHVDVIVTDAQGNQDRLVAGLELAPPDPEVDIVSPVLASLSGGTAVTVTGSGFRPGALVVLGDQIYADGVPGGATVVDENTLTLVTRATVGGEHDLVVIDPTGVEGRMVDALLVTDVPVLASVFPASGAVVGGTQVSIVGSDFVEGAEVHFGGVAAQSVTVVGPNRIEAVAPPGGGVGSISLQVTNPGGLTSAATFDYVAQADPSLTAVSPGQGPASGGAAVTLSGGPFAAGTQVVFGVDPFDGSGGVPAGAVTFVDESTLEVVVPAGSGTVAVMARDPNTGQAAVLAAAYSYVPEGGGGGGCGSIAAPGPGTWRDALAGSLWFIALFAVGLARWAAARRRTPALAS